MLGSLAEEKDSIPLYERDDELGYHNLGLRG
jgi:hypothetical protein